MGTDCSCQCTDQKSDLQYQEVSASGFDRQIREMVENTKKNELDALRRQQQMMYD